MHVTYDPSCDQMYLRLQENAQVSGPVQEILPWMRLDLDASNQVIGIEIDAARLNGVDVEATRQRVIADGGSWTAYPDHH